MGYYSETQSYAFTIKKIDSILNVGGRRTSIHERDPIHLGIEPSIPPCYQPGKIVKPLFIRAAGIARSMPFFLLPLRDSSAMRKNTYLYVTCIIVSRNENSTRRILLLASCVDRTHGEREREITPRKRATMQLFFARRLSRRSHVPRLISH